MYETPQSHQILSNLIKKYGEQEVVDKLSVACGYTKEEVRQKISTIKNKENNMETVETLIEECCKSYMTWIHAVAYNDPRQEEKRLHFEDMKKKLIDLKLNK